MGMGSEEHTRVFARVAAMRALYSPERDLTWGCLSQVRSRLADAVMGRVHKGAASGQSQQRLTNVPRPSIFKSSYDCSFLQ